MRAERRSRRGASQVTRSANSQLLEYIANGVRQRPPDPGTIGHGPVGVSCSDDGLVMARGATKGRQLTNVAAEPTSDEFIRGTHRVVHDQFPLR